MIVKPSESVTVDFTTCDPTTGALVDADSLPSGALVENGTDDGAVTVTVTNKSTGRYKAAFTVPADYTAGTEVDLYISATVDSIGGGGVVWRGKVDSKFVSDLNDLSAADVNAEVDAALSDYAPATAAALATVDGNVDLILEDTGTTLPATLATIDGIVDDILLDTGTTLPSAISALNNLSAAQVNAEVDAALADYAPATASALATVDSNVDQLLLDLAVVDGIVDAILIDTGTTIQDAITALNDLSSSDITTALSSYGASTHSAADVWSSETRTLSSFGTLVSDIWTSVTDSSGITTLLSRLSSARAGYLDKLNVTGTLAHSDDANTYKADVSGVATSAALATVDTLVDAIKAVTDKLDTAMELDGAEYRFTENALEQAPSGTGGDATEANQTTILSNLATVDGVVDAIKVIADKLDTALELDGAVYRYTENALEQAPSGTGGDATAENQTAILNALNVVDGIVDSILIDTGTDIPAAISALNNLSSSDITSALTSYGASTHSAADVWSSETRTLSSFGTLVSDVATAVWASGTRTLTSFGTLVSDIWTAVADSSGVTTLLSRLSSARAGYLDKLNVTGTLANSDAADSYKADVSSLATSAALATIDANVDSVLEDTGTTIPATLSGLATSAALATVDANVDSVLEDTGTTIPATLSGLATSSALATVDTVVDSILVNTGTDIPTLIAALNDLSASEVATEIADALGTDAIAELTTDPGAEPTVKQAIMLLYMWLHNANTATSSARTIKNNAGSAVLTATVSDDGTTYNQGNLNDA